ncbi:MAG: serine/threonine protein kinase [Phycisphaerae bacterium]|nr:serine/threonine protein kinase [Phycisphaerae bacterium]
MADNVSGYSIISKLGDGARSQVYRVVRPETGEIFALKRVIRDPAEDSRYLDQAINEFQIAGSFSHPNLRKVFELKRIRKLLRLVEVQVIMEFVDGTSLDKARPTRIDRILEIFLCVAGGLRAMHEKGYLHADIKPNNVLIARDGSVRIIDFGQCCEIGHQKERIQGTPDYIAPEQVERSHLTPQTDVYNFGATLYWATTGKTFPTVMSRTSKKVEGSTAPVDAPAPIVLNPEVPPGLSKLIMDCCEHDRNDRPRTMKEVIHRLELIQHVVERHSRGTR